MRKKDEVACQDSCLNRAEPDEPIFVLLARDRAAIIAVHEWISQRIKLGKNNANDGQIVGAWHWILDAEAYRIEREERGVSQ